MQFTCDEATKDETALAVAIEDTPNAMPFSTASKNLSSRTKSKTEVLWNPAEWKAAKDSTEVQRTPDLSALVQSVVDQADWQPGNSMAFLFRGKGKRVATASKGPTAEAPRLVIDADVVELDSTLPASRYNIRLHFAASPVDRGEVRVFDVYAQDQLVWSDVTIDPTGATHKRHSVQLLENVSIADKLRLRFVPKKGQAALAGLEIIRNTQQSQ